MPTGPKNWEGETDAMNIVRKHADAVLFGTAAFFLLVGFSLYYVKLAGKESLIVVHFVSGRGADILGEKGDALKMLLAGTGIAVMNAFLAGILRDRDRVMARCAGIITLLLALLILVALVCIITVT